MIPVGKLFMLQMLSFKNRNISQRAYGRKYKKIYKRYVKYKETTIKYTQKQNGNGRK